jgi:dipeptidyl aminopeptidase/acylaminoacyl peptidase
MNSGGRAAVRLLALAFALAAVWPLGAQTPRPLTLVGLAELPRILDPQLSPDGLFVVYMLTRADWKANRQIGHIWRQAIAGGAPTQMTSGDAGEANARWAPDGRSILFLAPRGEGGAQIFLLPASGGDARQLTRHGTSVSQPAWAPDGSAIYFLASDPPTAEDRDRVRLRDDVYVFEENFKQRHVWKATVASGAEQKITDGDWSVLSYRLSRDGRQITAHRSPTPLAGDNYRSEVWLMDADGSNARPLTDNEIEEGEADLSPDNTHVLFLAEAADTNSRLEPYYSSTLFLAPATGGPPRALLPDFPYAIEHASWAADSRTILAVVNMGVHSEIFRIDVAARRATALTDGRHSVQFWSAVPSAARMVFQFDEPTRLGDAWTLAFDGGAPARVTGVYDSLARDFALPRQEQVVWKGADGVGVEGLLFYPIGYEPGRRYPLVVQLHGGPQDSDKFGYGSGVLVNYVPVLAANGYAVLRPNYRGSTGYGNAFLRDVVGGYFRNMHTDVLAGVDHLIQQGLADPDRLAVMGWSAGGHLTNKLVTVTDRFKAASSTAGAANWTSLFAQTDTRANRSLWFGGTPWQPNAPIEVFWNNSPVKDAAKVRTPTMFVVGQEDPRVPLQQSIEMYRAIRSNGVPTQLLVAPREGHQWGELRHQIYKGNAELEWFERYVMGRAYTWERAPDGS